MENINGIGVVRENGGSKYIVIDNKICDFAGIEKGDLIYFTINDIKKKESDEEGVKI